MVPMRTLGRTSSGGSPSSAATADVTASASGSTPRIAAQRSSFESMRILDSHVCGDCGNAARFLQGNENGPYRAPCGRTLSLVAGPGTAGARSPQIRNAIGCRNRAFGALRRLVTSELSRLASYLRWHGTTRPVGRRALPKSCNGSRLDLRGHALVARSPARDASDGPGPPVAGGASLDGNSSPDGAVTRRSR